MRSIIMTSPVLFQYKGCAIMILNPEDYPQVRETTHLKPHSTLTLPMISEFDIAESFFVKRSGLWVSPILDLFFRCGKLTLERVEADFKAQHSSEEREEIYSAVDCLVTMHETEDVGHDKSCFVGMLITATDEPPRDIALGLPEMVECTMYLNDIARIIEKQFRGNPGFLLVNGEANYFFVSESFDLECILLARYRQQLLRWEVTIGDRRDHLQPPPGGMIICLGVIAT